MTLYAWRTLEKSDSILRMEQFFSWHMKLITKMLTISNQYMKKQSRKETIFVPYFWFGIKTISNAILKT